MPLAKTCSCDVEVTTAGHKFPALCHSELIPCMSLMFSSELEFGSKLHGWIVSMLLPIFVASGVRGCKLARDCETDDGKEMG